jgi:hypothetical protein
VRPEESIHYFFSTFTALTILSPITTTTSRPGFEVCSEFSLHGSLANDLQNACCTRVLHHPTGSTLSAVLCFVHPLALLHVPHRSR